MPIEIKELQIKAIVAPESSDTNGARNADAIEKIRKEILKECLQEMKNLLKEQKER